MVKQKPIEEELPEAPKLTEEEIQLLQTQDGVLAMYIAQNRKLNEAAKAINAYTLKLDGEDKGFERWHKLTTTNREIAENVEYLRGLVIKQYGTDKVDSTTLTGSNILEEMLSKKKVGR